VESFFDVVFLEETTGVNISIFIELKSIFSLFYQKT